uniref:PGG domain-containing protein n=1 Tax=Heterorhabditis bacteriophora TaxID=37862 RepID=A0A1I7XMB7_HETBA
MRYILLEWIPWLLRMKLPRRKNTLDTIKENWKYRQLESRNARTAFDYTDGTEKLVKLMHNVMKENFDTLISLVDVSHKNDKKVYSKLKVLQKIYEHVKMIRKHDDDSQEDKHVAFEWRFAAIVVDRLGLLSFSSLIAATALIISIRAPYLVA